MSKATRIRQQNARERIAAQRAAARRAEIRRQVLITGGSVLAVIAIVVAVIVVKISSGSSSSPSSSTGSTQPASVVNQITGVPASALDSVGNGGSSTYANVQTIKGSGSTLTSGGKPEILYMGAEYCPYCAAERWAMAVTMSRFGTFSGLHFIHSSSTDVYPSTPTLTFYKSTYQSNYINFTPVEWYSESNTKVLQTPTAAQLATFQKYDAPPYVQSSSDSGSFPFVDFGNKYVIVGASYNPQVLAGKTWAQVAAALNDPSNPISKAVLGVANQMTAAICKLTNGQPGSVCSSSGVTQSSGNI
jgi:thiol-disulfide isomerase/thioredoxin